MGEKSKVIIELFGVLDVTGEVIGMWIILGIITLISLVIKFTLKEKPGKFQNIIETGIEKFEYQYVADVESVSKELTRIMYLHKNK